MVTKREREAARQRRYYVKNKEKVAATAKKWRAENPEKSAAGIKKWQDSNPEKVAASKKATAAKTVENLSDWYVASKLSRLKGIHQTPAQLRQYPEIIDCYRAIMKLRRLCRIKNRENGK